MRRVEPRYFPLSPRVWLRRRSAKNPLRHPQLTYWRLCVQASRLVNGSGK